MRLADSTTILGSKEVPADPPQAMAASTAMNPGKRIVPKADKQTACETSSHLDDAAWERIFREKFADSNYYNSRLPKSRSPLAS